jgi:hypothetical protein
VGAVVCSVLFGGCALIAQRAWGGFALTDNSDQAITLRLPVLHPGETVYNHTTVAKARSTVQAPG